MFGLFCKTLKNSSLSQLQTLQNINSNHHCKKNQTTGITGKLGIIVNLASLNATDLLFTSHVFASFNLLSCKFGCLGRFCGVVGCIVLQLRGSVLGLKPCLGGWDTLSKSHMNAEMIDVAQWMTQKTALQHNKKYHCVLLCKKFHQM